MAKVTGIGGVFFQSKGDPAALAAWYQKHLVQPDRNGLPWLAIVARSHTFSGRPANVHLYGLAFVLL